MSIDISVSGLNTEYTVSMLGQDNVAPALSETVPYDAGLPHRAIVDIDTLSSASVNVTMDESPPIDMDVHEFINIGGASSYNDLTDRPKIEGVTLIGDKTYEELNLLRISNSELEDILNL